MAPDAADVRMHGRGGSPPLALTSADPRIFGLVPALPALALGLGAMVLGMVLIAVGRAPIGVVAVVLGAVLVAFALDSARRWPTSPLAQGLVRVADAIRSRLGLAGVFAGSWSEAVRELVRLRAELRALREERDGEQFELGGAAARGDEKEMEERRARISELEGRIEEAERAMTAAVESARARVGRERASIKRTRPFAVEEVGQPARKTTVTTPRRRRP
jgi:hypothetical protein